MLSVVIEYSIIIPKKYSMKNGYAIITPEKSPVLLSQQKNDNLIRKFLLNIFSHIISRQSISEFSHLQKTWPGWLSRRVKATERS
jgi:hypothetical protein